MTDILNTVATQVSGCIPNTPMEYLAMQMARRLNDLEHVRNYLAIVVFVAGIYALLQLRGLIDSRLLSLGPDRRPGNLDRRGRLSAPADLHEL